MSRRCDSTGFYHIVQVVRIMAWYPYYARLPGRGDSGRSILATGFLCLSPCDDLTRVLQFPQARQLLIGVNLNTQIIRCFPLKLNHIHVVFLNVGDVAGHKAVVVVVVGPVGPVGPVGCGVVGAVGAVGVVGFVGVVSVVVLVV